MVLSFCHAEINQQISLILGVVDCITLFSAVPSRAEQFGLPYRTNICKQKPGICHESIFCDKSELKKKIFLPLRSRAFIVLSL